MLHRHDEKRFSEPRRFAHGLETGGADDASRAGHVAQEFFARQAVEGQIRRDPVYRRRPGTVIEAVQRNLWVPTVPRFDGLSVPVIQEIHQVVLTARWRELEELRPEQWRAHGDTSVGQV